MSTPSTRTADDLVALVTAVPGVRGIEPGVASTLRTLDARIRRSGSATRYGLVVDDDGSVTVEVGLDGTRPVREVVHDVQVALAAALAPVGAEQGPVRVRVQSIAAGG